MLTILPLIGRERELTQLEQMAGHARAGYGGVVLLGGEAGIGKSALMLHLARSVEGFHSVIGRCPGEGETSAFGPWREAVTALPGREGTEWELPFADGNGPHALSKLAEALCAWLGQRGEPLLLVLEDIHWADSASLELLRHVTPRLHALPVLILSSYRSDEVHREHPLWSLLPELERGGAVRTLLGNLSREAVAEMAAMVGVPHLTGPVYDRTRGHSLFTRELLLAGEPGALPESVQQMIDAKVRRLSPPARELMQAAAMIGERFGYDLLLRVTRVAEEELIGRLEEAIALRVLRSDPERPDTFHFDHALVREALIAPLIGPRRRRWHQQIAEALLAEPESDLDATAFHLSRANDPRAADYLIASGDRALRMGALEHARHQYEGALANLSAAASRRGEVLLKLGHAVMHPHLDRARSYWEQAEQTDDPHVRVWARHLLALWHLRAGDRAALSRMEAVQAEQEELLRAERYRQLERDLFGQPCDYPRIATDRALCLILAGRHSEAGDLLRRLEPRGASGPEWLQVEAYLAFVEGRMTEVDSLWRRLIAARLELRQYRQALVMAVERLYTLLHWGRADVPDAVDASAAEVAELESLARERAGFGFLPRGYSALGVYHFMRGDWERARLSLTEYIRHHPADLRPQLRSAAVTLALEEGDLAGARAFLEPLSPHHPEDEPGKNIMNIFVHFSCARIALAEGDPAEAERWLGAADRWVEIGRTPSLELVAAVNRAEVCWRAGQVEAAERAAREGLGLAERAEAVWCQLRSHRVLARVAASRGEEQVAEGHWQAAITLAERCRFPYEHALTQLARGRAEEVAAARAVFARLGARPALAEAEAALGGPGGPAAVAPASRPGADVLTEREVAVIRLVAEGLTDKEVAARLYISPRTVEHHLNNAANKLGTRGRAALVAQVARLGLLEEREP